eukprot:jgi/Tetstr1/429315/TSEL_019233.t1
MKHAGCLEWSNEESSGGKSPASPGPGEAVGRQASGCSSVLQQPSRSPEQAPAAGVAPCATTRTSPADERTREGHAAACRPFPQPASYQADIVPPSRSDNTSGGLPRRQQWPRLKSGASLWLLLLGQLLALLLTSTGILSEVLADAGFRAPMLQAFLAYSAIAIVWIPTAWARGELGSLVADRRLLALFVVLGAIDAEATFAAVSAYRYTSLFSVQLLDSLTVPMVMALSYAALRVRYTCGHVAGAAICLGGVFALIFHDAAAEGWENTAEQHSLRGDLWMLAATALYALSNVAQEALLQGRGVTPAQWLAGLALPAAAVSGLQHLLLERAPPLGALPRQAVLCLAGFTLCQLAFYSLTPVLLQRSSAAVLNLSLLAADCYAALAAVALFQLPFSPLYALALCLALAGSALFQLLPEGRRLGPTPEEVKPCQRPLEPTDETHEDGALLGTTPLLAGWAASLQRSVAASWASVPASAEEAASRDRRRADTGGLEMPRL